MSEMKQMIPMNMIEKQASITQNKIKIIKIQCPWNENGWEKQVPKRQDMEKTEMICEAWLIIWN